MTLKSIQCRRDVRNARRDCLSLQTFQTSLGDTFRAGSEPFALFHDLRRFSTICLWGRGSKTLHAWFSPACTAKTKKFMCVDGSRKCSILNFNERPSNNSPSPNPHYSGSFELRSTFIVHWCSWFRVCLPPTDAYLLYRQSKKKPSRPRPLERRCSSALARISRGMRVFTAYLHLDFFFRPG
jgi:hypothetical protein